MYVEKQITPRAVGGVPLTSTKATKESLTGLGL